MYNMYNKEKARAAAEHGIGYCLGVDEIRREAMVLSLLPAVCTFIMDRVLSRNIRKKGAPSWAHLDFLIG
jgi:hypothetical protein